MTGLARGMLYGAAAGAAGTTALDSVTYLDMTFRGRPPSSTPEATVERLADDLNVAVPGDEAKRQNRVAGLGPLTGIAAGVAMGAVLGVARAAGWRPPVAVSYTAAAVGALIGTNGPMTVLKVTDPRTWAPTDWVADIVPHLAYAAVTVFVLRRLED
ncbi:hypothetical protein GA0115240_156332 [Streptomyces sp. DvalAA-14]|uniref:hypothetical protein n=1 Tax=unclassified Streptomyces TaxID=2593676 RepID=UPI00081BA4BE|nr:MULTISPECIES: hypothetical protein [unclassified Streptomyces]MYS23772.1 hypothetical protein [Streptomyces sp. SID4948]SCE38491.1 hypothetical protein GA0115240_156332 [Streptomyces sp. DvalAA-14]